MTLPSSPSERPQISIKKVRSELLGRDDKDWQAYVSIHSPTLRESGEVLSLGDKYIVSLGAHSTHNFMIMDRGVSEPLDVGRCNIACSLLAYAIDTAVVPLYLQTKRPLLREQSFAKTFHPTIFNSAERYSQKLVDCADSAIDVNSILKGYNVNRILCRKIPRNDQCYFYPWPVKSKTQRAIAAYSLGLLSIPASNRILNFWRAIEAVLPTKDKREQFFQQLNEVRVSSVRAEVRKIPMSKHKTRRFVDLTRPLRNVAFKRWESLIATYNTPSQALEFLYWNRRWKAAHADRQSLEYDFIESIADLLADAELLRFAARAAIEANW